MNMNAKVNLNLNLQVWQEHKFAPKGHAVIQSWKILFRLFLSCHATAVALDMRLPARIRRESALYSSSVLQSNQTMNSDTANAGLQA
jgi:hypothetical protein